jgi:2-polyprenyl-3-methyl-5-hydroxy-6-metoxy-1,4-benzoquinol methylase
MEPAFREIPQRYLPRHAHYYYARIKLATDPLYVGVGEVLASRSEPLLDVGCGIGLLAHTLRAQGFEGRYAGVDVDAGKIASAQDACARAGLTGLLFNTVDLTERFPEHRGNVALLDIIQFLPPDAQNTVLERAFESLVPGAILVIRTGLQRTGLRTRFTRNVDHLAKLTRWMNVGPNRYPRREVLEERFARHGMQPTFTPLRGRLPFENWMIYAERPMSGNAA